MSTVKCRDCNGNGSVYMEGKLWICITCDGDGELVETE